MFPFFAAVFLGAFLLFLVQPMMGRFVLPWWGGAPAVWTACLLFFQTALLLGYFYAHLLSKHLPPKRQWVVHLALLVAACIALPPVPVAPVADATDALSPVWAVLAMLSSTIGPPFVMLAASSPLLQRWFALGHPQRSPYRLYALSNAGSLLALLLYPVLIEPWLARVDQAYAWSWLFVGFAFAIVWAGWKLRHASPARETPDVAAEEDAPAAPSLRQRLGWIGWGALGTGLLAASTSALTLDVAAVPFLWIGPLTIYLGSLILTFDHPRWYRRGVFAFLLPVTLLVSLDQRVFASTAPLGQLLITHLAALAVATMICHGEVYRSRPAATHLTAFYLSFAAGGVLGTLLVAVASPAWFNFDVDLPVLWTAVLAGFVLQLTRERDLRLARLLAAGFLAASVLAPLLRPVEEPGLGARLHLLLDLAQQHPLTLACLAVLVVAIDFRLPPGWARQWTRRTTVGLILLVAFSAWHTVGSALRPPPGLVESRRGFFGEVTVTDYPSDDPRAASRFMGHGNTTHGIQLRHPDYRSYPTSYYSEGSGIWRVLSRANQQPGRHIGVIGLGSGTLAAYGMAQDHLTFFEIDPNVVDLAHTRFTYLADTAAEVDVRLGDGRRLLEQEAADTNAPRYDVLVLDAFSSDAVPVHLLTREAFATYLRRLAPDGVLVVNVSNRLVDLRRILEAHAQHFGLTLAHLIHRPEADRWWAFSSEWIALAPQRAALDDRAITSWTGLAAPTELEGVTWTDEFASLWSVLR
ncbi:fused MFS/spermidine synthase [Actomonas aquatica]|uniref:Fused MFS/spermidine synthase n=1 Tax=Actomonas aquatica TaxID=2866162 RepID=A0ABZ1C8D6_9BACT|nr:fused MFS/spermidine synthase [Opitutus sp. WL0086]WRQ87959.1 fused MFS/spermidine synthase [Opitutus sp. WL0086]